VIYEKHATLAGISIDQTFIKSVDITLLKDHTYIFRLYAECGAYVIADATAISDFATSKFEDGVPVYNRRIEWRYIDVPNTQPVGGCPYVSTWDGTGYVTDNNLLPTSEDPNRVGDVQDYYVLQTPLTRRNGLYSLKISEFEQEHDYLDQVRLIAVDHATDVSIAVTQDGQILTYKNPNPPTSAVDSFGNDVTPHLSAIDGDYYQGVPGSYLEMDFGDVDSDTAKLVMTVDCKCPMQVQVLNSTGDWWTIETVYPRANFATEIIDLPPYLPHAHPHLKVRLLLINQKIDFVGLDTSPQAETTVQYGRLVSAIHSHYGNIKPMLKLSDDIYAELIPGQEIELHFWLPPHQQGTRDYLLFTEGHYTPFTG